jgi:hypothetical protein
MTIGAGDGRLQEEAVALKWTEITGLPLSEA